MDPITMMVASIGMQFFNNYATNKKNEEIQAQQREFQKAAAEHDFERMREAQARSAKLALELEEEVHNDRVKEINDSYDAILENFANNFAVANWPLNVLPFIMKGESFGSLFSGTAKSISMHCIFTPSNCSWFNAYFYDDLDTRIEAEMNNNWNAQSSHPIVYYGGAWNRRMPSPLGTTVVSDINLNDIALLKTKLKGVPTMVITPYFDPYLHFRVELWGMGRDSEYPYRIDIPHGENEETNRIFSYDYCKDNKPELTDDLCNTTMEEFVPYLESLIGFVADKYFWSNYHRTPSLPYSSMWGNLNKKIHSQIITLYKKEMQSIVNGYDKYDIWLEMPIKYYVSVESLLDDNEKKSVSEWVKCTLRKNFNLFTKVEDIKKLKYISSMLSNEDNLKKKSLKNLIEELSIIKTSEVEFLSTDNIDIIEIFRLLKSRLIHTDMGVSFVYVIWNPNIIIGKFCQNDLSDCSYISVGKKRYFVLHNASCDVDPQDNLDIYIYNFTNKTNNIMLKGSSYEESFAKDFYKVGKELGGLLDKLKLFKDKAKEGKSDDISNVWGDNFQTSETDSLENVVNYFVYNAGKTVPAQRVDNMELNDIFNWIDENVNPFATKVYLIKTFVEKYKKYAVCVFFATEDTVMLSETDAKVCFITSSLEKMKTIFKNNNISVIPLK